MKISNLRLRYNAPAALSIRWVLPCVAVCCRVFNVLCLFNTVGIAVSCSMLQCVVVCCSVLQCVAVSCSMLLCVVVCCSVLQYIAVCCSVLAVCWSSGCETVACSFSIPCSVCMLVVAACCSLSQCVAVCCSGWPCLKCAGRRVSKRLLASFRPYVQCACLYVENMWMNRGPHVTDGPHVSRSSVYT